MPESPAHEKVLITAEFFKDRIHGSIACHSCHKGDPNATERSAAHKGLVPAPSVSDPDGTCGRCHRSIAADWRNSLHRTLRGFRWILEVRSGKAPLSGVLEKQFKRHCTWCHSSCGQCHVAVPASAGGGLVSGHKFNKTPKMVYNCTACHGTRVGDEFRGNTDDGRADVHYVKGKQCTFCHKGGEMHGKGAKTANNRYEVTTAPKCTDCHDPLRAGAPAAALKAHKAHRDKSGGMKLDCRVCHTLPYINCFGCHVKDDKDGKPTYEANAPGFEPTHTFKIGLNHIVSKRRPYKYVVLRHAPGAPTGFQSYGKGLQPKFDLEPTWRYASPHRVVRQTPQNANCTDSCHGKSKLFLQASDVPTGEKAANQRVIVPKVPGP